MIDTDDNRLQLSKRFGATAIINNSDNKAAEKVMQMTNGRGVDTAIEAVGIPLTFNLCEEVVTAGGTIANIGVHGKKADLHPVRLIPAFSLRIILNSIKSSMLMTPLVAQQLLMH